MNASVERQTLLRASLNEHLKVMQEIELLGPAIEHAVALIADAVKAGNKLLLCGNGGSAADSQHLAAEFTGRFVNDRRPLAGLSLSSDAPVLTSIANDYSFDEVFARQLVGLGRAGDCLLAMSTSGNSRNVIRAVEVARKSAIRTIGLLGRDGGTLRPLCDVPIVVRSHTTARIQEAHLFIGHMLCAMVEARLEGG